MFFVELLFLFLLIFIDKQIVDNLQPLFEKMGKNIRYMGPPGSGQHTKMVFPIFLFFANI